MSDYLKYLEAINLADKICQSKPRYHHNPVIRNKLYAVYRTNSSYEVWNNRSTYRETCSSLLEAINRLAYLGGKNFIIGGVN